MANNFYKDGSIYKFKAKLVARGHEQTSDVDYDETFSPVVRMTSVLIILTLSIQLIKALCGLKQSPSEWNIRLYGHLE